MAASNAKFEARGAPWPPRTARGAQQAGCFILQVAKLFAMSVLGSRQQLLPHPSEVLPDIHPEQVA